MNVTTLAVMLGLALVGVTQPALAQAPTRIPRIGIMTPAACPENHPIAGFLLTGLKTRGYELGRSILLECPFSTVGLFTAFRAQGEGQCCPRTATIHHVRFRAQQASGRT